MARADLVPDVPAGVGFAFSMRPPAPLVDTAGAFAVPPEALLDWAAEAEAGARCVYARATSIALHARLAAKARALAGQGVLTLSLARHAAGDGLFDYIAKRVSFAPLHSAGADPPRARAGAAAAESHEDRLDAAAALILTELQQAARRGRRCPSDFDLARAVGLATRHQAAWRVRTLERADKIAVETVTGPDGCPWRIVTIGRHRTAAPPAARENARETVR